MVIEISCVEVWREISNYIDETTEPELRSRMEAHFKVCKHCTRPFLMERRMSSS